MADHLYPARPGMMRRGTPVVYHGCTYVVDDERPAPHGWVVLSQIGATNADVSIVRLDLRDETARAHAAMPYTRVVVGEGALFYVLLCPELGEVRGMRARTLTRMRMMDPSVTVAEARAALDWAHAASGGGGE